MVDIKYDFCPGYSLPFYQPQLKCKQTHASIASFLPFFWRWHFDDKCYFKIVFKVSINILLNIPFYHFLSDVLLIILNFQIIKIVVCFTFVWICWFFIHCIIHNYLTFRMLNLGLSVVIFLVIGVVVMALFCLITRYFNKKLEKALDDEN